MPSHSLAVHFADDAVAVVNAHVADQVSFWQLHISVEIALPRSLNNGATDGWRS